MTYSARETSVESGQPIELYEFHIGTTFFRYTSSEDEVTFNTFTWFPRSIERSDPTQATEDRRQPLTVSLPSDDDVSVKYIGIPPGELLSLQIIRYHRGDAEAFVLWTGRITGASFKEQGSICILQGLTDEAAFSRPVPRFKYSGLCNHILFDGGCLLARASFKYTGAVSAVSGNTITVTGLNASKGADWASGGYVTFQNTDYRLILDQPNDTLTLPLPFEDDVLGQSVDVFAGCDHSLTTCNTKFSNVLNFGGFPYVPTLNPFEVGLD